MTEAEWLACDDPSAMNHGPAVKWWATAKPFVKLDARRERLLGVACANLLIEHLTFPGVREALEVFERFADGACDRKELRAARVVVERCLEESDRTNPVSPNSNWPGGYPVTRHAAILLREAGRTKPTIPIGQRWGYWACLGRHCPTAAALIRDIAGNPFRPVALNPDWRTSTVLSLAQHIYDSRDFSPMPILADALQDAGCDNDDILTHCRDANAPHVRGCWVVDLVLGKV